MAEMRVLHFPSPSHIYYLPPQLLLSAAPVFVPSGINATARGGVLIKISESSYTIGDDGRLVIPADDLTEMGLTAGQDVFVAYITDDDLANRYHEFTVSSVSLSELDTPPADCHTAATIGAGRHRLERRGANCLHGRSYHHYGGHTPDRR